MAVRSKNFSKNHEFDFVCPFLHIKMLFIASNHTYYQRRYIPLHIETDFSPPSHIVSEYQLQSWKMLKNGHFHTTGVFTLHVARVSMQTTHYTLGRSFLYLIVPTACCCDPPLPSNQPRMRSMQARFSQFSFLSLLMLNEWRTFARATGAPQLASGSKFNTTCWTTGPKCVEKITLLRQSAAPQ